MYLNFGTETLPNGLVTTIFLFFLFTKDNNNKKRRWAANTDTADSGCKKD